MVNSKLKLPQLTLKNGSLLVLSLVLLASTYLFQRINYLVFLTAQIHDQSARDAAQFIVNKTTRLLINDVACLIIIRVLFIERKYLQVGWWVFLFELIILLPVYLAVKLSLEGPTEISSPLLSQFHRLIVNPMLMILLMISFLYMRHYERSRT